MPPLNPKNYRSHRLYDDGFDASSIHQDQHQEYIQEEIVHQRAPSWMTAKVVWFLILMHILCMMGCAWFIWKNHQMSQEMVRLHNKIELVHQRIPLLDQMTEQKLFKQYTRDKIQQIEQRFAAIKDASNQISSSIARLSGLDFSEEIEQIQMMEHADQQKLEQLTQQILILSRQQENIMRHNILMQQSQGTLPTQP